MKLTGQGFSRCCAAVLVLGLSGCAATPPKTVEISGVAQQQEVKGKLSRFLGQSCVNAVDSDVQLSWRAYGQEKVFSATMQAMAPASLRLALVDPLGRPLILLGAHENGFTLADNNEAVGYTGKMDLDVVHKFLPEFIPTRDLFYWLSGRVSRIGMRVVSTRMDAEESLYWYEITYKNRRNTANDGMTHMLALNDENQLMRHMVLDADNDIQFEAKYSNYSSTPRTCGWPGKVVISGEALEADFSLEFTKIFNYKPIDRKRFHVRLPPHFTVRKIINS
jgi:outer membrane biogenesis lipoprotein LolB